MSHIRKSLWRGALAAATVAGFVTSAAAQMELKIMAPAAPGGGWDQTARSMQQALTQSGIAKGVQVTNVPGAGGSVGIVQFVNGAKGDDEFGYRSEFIQMVRAARTASAMARLER